MVCLCKVGKWPWLSSVLLELKNNNKEKGAEFSSGLVQSNANIAVVGQLIRKHPIVNRPRRSFHQVGFSRLIPKRECVPNWRAQVDHDDDDGAEQIWESEHYEEQKWYSLRHSGRDRIADCFLEILEYLPALLYPIHDSGKRVVNKDKVRSISGHFRTSRHRNPNITLLKSWSII